MEIPRHRHFSPVVHTKQPPGFRPPLRVGTDTRTAAHLDKRRLPGEHLACTWVHALPRVELVPDLLLAVASDVRNARRGHGFSPREAVPPSRLNTPRISNARPVEKGVIMRPISALAVFTRGKETHTSRERLAYALEESGQVAFRQRRRCLIVSIGQGREYRRLVRLQLEVAAKCPLSGLVRSASEAPATRQRQGRGVGLFLPENHRAGAGPIRAQRMIARHI